MTNFGLRIDQNLCKINLDPVINTFVNSNLVHSLLFTGTVAEHEDGCGSSSIIDSTTFTADSNVTWSNEAFIINASSPMTLEITINPTFNSAVTYSIRIQVFENKIVYGPRLQGYHTGEIVP